MHSLSKIESQYWLQRSRWLFVGGSLIAGIVALAAEGPGLYLGLGLLGLCVFTICSWSLTGKPTLYWTVAIVTIALIALGWTVEEPEPALFQSILITAAVGWRVDRLSLSLGMLAVLVLVPLIGSLGPSEAEWGWWNWSVGTLFTWTLGRVIRLLDQTLNELTVARSQLIDSAAREERLRVSRDVHDLVGHSLTAMLLNIRAAKRALDSDLSVAKQALIDAESVGTAGIKDIRTVLVDLHDDNDSIGNDGSELSSLPTGDAVIHLLQQQSHINVETTGTIAELEGPLAVAVYRILQECITNCSKHAVEKSASISVSVSESEINLRVQNALKPGHKDSGSLSDKTLGLISMRERATSLGGTFKAGIEGSLWRVHCRIPRHG